MIHDYETNRAQGGRAANDFLASTLPAHGRHSWPNALADTVRDNGTGNGSIVVPSRAVPSKEIVGNTVESKIADPLASPRKGRVIAAEGLAARIPALEDNLIGGFQDARSADAAQYEMKRAYGRSAVANGSDTDSPTWVSARDPQIRFDFAHGTSAERANGNIPPLSERSSISQVGTDLSRLDLTSRPRQSYGRINAVPGRRPNEAEVRD